MTSFTAPPALEAALLPPSLSFRQILSHRYGPSAFLLLFVLQSSAQVKLTILMGVLSLSPDLARPSFSVKAASRILWPLFHAGWEAITCVVLFVTPAVTLQFMLVSHPLAFLRSSAEKPAKTTA